MLTSTDEVPPSCHCFILFVWLFILPQEEAAVINSAGRPCFVWDLFPFILLLFPNPITFTPPNGRPVVPHCSFPASSFPVVPVAFAVPLWGNSPTFLPDWVGHQCFLQQLHQEGLSHFLYITVWINFIFCLRPGSWLSAVRGKNWILVRRCSDG